MATDSLAFPFLNVCRTSPQRPLVAADGKSTPFVCASILGQTGDTYVAVPGQQVCAAGVKTPIPLESPGPDDQSAPEWS